MLPDRSAYFARWAALHGGYDPATGGRLVRWWLTGVYVVARPLARAGVPPFALTLGSVVVAYGVPAAAWWGGGWAYAAAGLAVASGFADNLDGAVAVLTDRATRVGFVADSVADRAADAAYLLALWWLGAPGGLAVAAGAAVVLLEYTRSRAGNAGMGEVGVVTVGERPTRVVVATMFLLAAGVLSGHQPLLAGLGAAATLVVCVIGWVQLAVVVRRVLR